VYNQDNRARVARDEALAEAAARDAERERKDTTSEQTIGLLQQRAEGRVADLGLSEQDKLVLEATKDLSAAKKDGRKRKRLPGEDDTDRDLRYAREREAGAGAGAGDEKLGIVRLRATKTSEAEAPIVDGKGNINLFPTAKSGTRSKKTERRPEVDREKAKRKEMEEGQGMHLSDAWGRRDAKGAWYVEKDGSVKDSKGRDVWGNEDPRRHQREAARTSQTDPLAFMKRAQVQLKVAEREKQQREEELQRHMDEEKRELDDFRLDGPPPCRRRSRDRREEKKVSRHRRRSRSRSRSRERHRPHRHSG
jgi:hypothetical protein